MPPSTAPGAKSMPAWKSPWVIGWIALVLLVLLVNVTLIILGFKTSPGLVVENFYDRGQDHEKHWARKQALDPGWLLRTDIPQDLMVGERSVLRFFLVDVAGRPAETNVAHFYAYRPSNAGQDFDLPMVQEGLGRFRVDVSFPLMGVWDILVAVRQGENEFSLGQRITVPGPRASSPAAAPR